MTMTFTFFRDDPWPPANPNRCQSCKLDVLSSEKAVHTDEGVMHTHCAITRFREIVDRSSVIVDEYAGGITGVIKLLKHAVHGDIHLEVMGRPSTEHRGIFNVKIIRDMSAT